LETPLEFALQLAGQAGELLLDYYHSDALAPSLKKDRTVVTQADLAVDHLLASAIQERFPQDHLISEELRPNYPSIDHTQAGQAVWIIDPLDGTTNFSLGLHFWGVLLARLVDGWPDLAVMYFPFVNELYTARRGQGATFNGQPLHIEPPGNRSPLSFFACCSRTHKHYQIDLPYKTRILGSTAYTLCTVARSMAIIGFESTAKIWDIAAPWLLVSEAGGQIETLDASRPFPLQARVDYAQKSYPVLAAATPELARRGHEKILPRASANLIMI
jgi:myo-inositol-1(or 4)-monophosphatase